MSVGGINIPKSKKSSKKKKSNGFWLYIKYRTPVYVLLVAIAFVGGLFVDAQLSNNRTVDQEIGKAAVLSLYNFQTVEELSDQMDDLKKITTEEVYNQLTVDRTDRALNVYLKFKAKPTVVQFETITDSYIIYSLATESIQADRKFAFFYNVNKNGLIDKVRESEIVDFTTNVQEGVK